MIKGPLLQSTLAAIGVGYVLGFFGEGVRDVLSRVSKWCIWGAWGMILLAAILYRGFGVEGAAAWVGIVGVSSLGLGASLTFAALLSLFTEVVVDNIKEARRPGKSRQEKAEDAALIAGPEVIRAQRRRDLAAWALMFAGVGVAVFLVFVFVPSFAEVVMGWMRMEKLTEETGIVHSGNYAWIGLALGAFMLGAAYWLRRL
ncbi:MAG: hypothetical protein HYT87_20280 [Nitrospirae bacterium]|nr:hypothetical protein [Nitrospirota bacterium]